MLNIAVRVLAVAIRGCVRCLDLRRQRGGLLQGQVVRPDDGVGVVDGNLSDIGHGLDLARHLLALRVGHGQAELLHTRLDGVPARQPRCKMHVSSQSEVGRVEDLVGGGVVEDGLGVDAGLVGEGAEARDGVVEGCVDLDGLGDQILELLDLVQLVLALDVIWACDQHASQETAKRGDAVALAD